MRSGAVICGAVLLGAGCTASYRAPDSLLQAIEDGRISPCHIVFVFGGILYDLGRDWDYDLQDELAEAGRLGISVTYYCDLFGVWFNYGTTEPGRLTADMIQRIAQIHQAGNCQTPLVFDAVGFSAGCEVFSWLHASSPIETGRRKPGFGGCFSFTPPHLHGRGRSEPTSMSRSLMVPRTISARLTS